MSLSPRDPLGLVAVEHLGPEAARVIRPERLRGVDPDRFSRRPRTVRILLENVLRHFDAERTDIDAVVAVANGAETLRAPELAYYPERVLLQDFTGVPVLVDLSMVRDAAEAQGQDPSRIQPVVPVDLIIDHSVQVDSFGSSRSFGINLRWEYERNSERYRFLRWAKSAFRNLRVVPPGKGICHQVNLERLATVVRSSLVDGLPVVCPDTLIGTDSHTTMVNGVSVLGWGVGGIEAESVLLGEPCFLSPPRAVGVELVGALREGATATDLVLTVTRLLRAADVVGWFVEFTGPGVRSLSVPDRATVSNMSPEYGATAALFPIDESTIAYLRGTGRPETLVTRVEAYARTQGLWGSPAPGATDYDRVITVDLSRIVPTISGPRNPDESVPLSDVAASFADARRAYREAHPARRSVPPSRPYPSDDPLQPYGERKGPPIEAALDERPHPTLRDGAVAIAAITSCTNTSNPSVMVGAGLIAKRAVDLGLTVPAHVKTSLAPGSRVVTDYLARTGLLSYLERLGFHLVGYGCTTCIGNSGPLSPPIDRQIRERDLFVAAVLSGNRNFEARIHNLVRANYLASPMLVVTYALAGRIDLDLTRDPLGHRPDGTSVMLRDLWPSTEEIRRITESSLEPPMFEATYRSLDAGGPEWEALEIPTGARYPWSPESTYLAEPPYLRLPPPWLPKDGRLARGARALALLPDKVSTDHISPAGEIVEDSPAGRYLKERGVPPSEFNTYGARRGHHEVMIRGTFANVRLKNQLVAPKEGGYTRHLPSGEVTTIFEASERYRRSATPLLVLAGKSYGQGSSRDWAAKGPRLLGVGAIIAESYERIHRSNLVQMGVLPLQFRDGAGWKSLGLTGVESFDLELRTPAGDGDLGPGAEIAVTARPENGPPRTFSVSCELRSHTEIEYYRAGGVLSYVLRHRFPSRNDSSVSPPKGGTKDRSAANGPLRPS